MRNGLDFVVEEVTVKHIKPLFLLSILAIVAPACNDDSSSSTTTPTTPTVVDTTCENDDGCGGEGHKCREGKCYTLVDAGGDCSGEDVLCRDDLECKEGTCQSKGPKAGDPCKDSGDCGSMLCILEVCSEPHVEGEGCATADDCRDGLMCIVDTCSGPRDVGGACQAPEHCAEGLLCIGKECSQAHSVGQSCDAPEQCTTGLCNAGVCAVKQDGGDECNATSLLCKDGFWCSEGHCVESPGLGEECSENTGCAVGLRCIAKDEGSVCMKTNANLGDDCGEFVRCNMRYACDAELQRCVRYSSEGAYCDQNTVCKGYCDKNECLDVHGECQADEDCKKDTYCCLTDDCDKKNVCIAYGHGPRGNTNEACSYKTIPGLFEAAIQCEWKTPDAGDKYPNHANVLMTPLVMNTPHESGLANEIIFTTYNNSDGGAPSGQGSDINYYGVIRIINAETCQLLESIFDDMNHIIGGSNLAMADLDGKADLNGNKTVEIVASRAGRQKTEDGATTGGGIVIFEWNEEAHSYQTKCWSKNHSASACTPSKDSKGNAVYDKNGYRKYDSCTNTLNWGGPAIHDLNDDGVPEIIGAYGDVFDINCNRLNPDNGVISELLYTATLGDLDGDGKVEIVGENNVYRWNTEKNIWESKYPKNTTSGRHPAYADFGTPIKDGTGKEVGFDYAHLDGIAETVACGDSKVHLITLGGQLLLNKTGVKGGGPCTVGDFNGDGFPEIATAFGDMYRVFDPKRSKDASCSDNSCILWEKYSQDASSSSTGSSLFDFDGDGAMEAVYADECYTRVYDGKTGDVLFSAYRSSSTWHEYPVIADIDNDESAEIVVGSNNGLTCPPKPATLAAAQAIADKIRCETTADCPYARDTCIGGLCRYTTSDANEKKNCSGTNMCVDVPKITIDPIHRGLRCASNKDCKSNVCVGGLCRCDATSTADQCNSRTDKNGNVLDEYGCVAPLAGDENGGKVCRAKRFNGTRVTGVRVMRDSLDRWTSSRNLWNQHAYNITNILDDMTVPKTSEWVQNFLTPGLNNFRQNVQGARGRNAAPDITGRFTGGTCAIDADGKVVLGAEICNRGTKMVASKMPASFYLVHDDQTREHLCTSYTERNVPIGGCLFVSCTIDDQNKVLHKPIALVSNDDGQGGKTTVECNEDNNEDLTTVNDCPVN